MAGTQNTSTTGDYIYTAGTGNKISRRATIYGAANIVLGGKCILQHDVIVRGDLRRVVRVGANVSADTGDAANSRVGASAVVVAMGRYGCVEHGAVLRPAYKIYQGHFSYFPLRIGDHVRIGRGATVEAAQIGSHVHVGDNSTVGRFAIIRNCAVVLAGSVLAPNTVVPSMCVFGGSPAKLVGRLPESFLEDCENESRRYYRAHGAVVSNSTPTYMSARSFSSKNQRRGASIATPTMSAATPPTVHLESLLDTDLYKMTMQQAVLEHFPDAQVTYRFTNRSKAKRFSRAAAAAIERGIAHLGALRVTADELAWLRIACPYFQERYLAFLEGFQLDPASQVRVRLVTAHAEDDVGDLELDIQGTWSHVILYEVPVMAIISETYFLVDDRDWTMHGQRELAERKGTELLRHGIVFSEFGTRRRRSFAVQADVLDGLVAATARVRAADGARTGRLLGTSNVYLAKKYGLTPTGTIAHEWTMAIAALQGYQHSNLRAMQLWDTVYQPPAFTPANPSEDLTIALTDTFSTNVFWADLAAEEQGRELLRRWRGLRQDSGDSRAFVERALRVFHELGIDPATKLIIFSDGLNVARCLELQALADDVGVLAGFGIGTNLTNDFQKVSDPHQPSKALNMVIKLYSVNGRPTVKISDELTKNTGDADEIAWVQPSRG
ncbi:nicotinate phosphoribosyltransferase [Malassezia sp. CBS 17886]|nr:nicotinate phosphoribosyltransferase [Malassezia sp. CBS 17886]